MKITVDTLDEAESIIGLIFDGRLDANARETAKNSLHQNLTGKAHTIIADLSNVPFIDSSGLSALVSGLRVARENNKEFVLVGLSRQAQMVFSLTMMDRVFNIYNSLDVALETITAS